MSTPRSENSPLVSKNGALFVATITATGSIAINAAIPGATEAGTELGLPGGANAAVVAAFTAGYALGHIFVGLITDERSMQRVLIAGLTGFILVSLFIGIAADAATFAWLRAAQGLCASVCPIIGRALIRQLGSGQLAAKRMSSASAIFAWAPVAAPLVAAWIGTSLGWRAVYIALAGYGLMSLAWILAGRAGRFATSQNTVPTWRERSTAIAAVLRSPSARVGILTGTFAFAGFFSFIATAANFGSSSGASWMTVPLSIAAVSAGYAIGAAVSRFALRFRPARTVLKFSLTAMVFASLGLAAMVAAKLSITAIVAFASIYSLLAGAAMPNATVLAMTPSTGSATFAVALLGMSKMVCASLVTWLAVWWPGSSFTYLALTMLICATSALLTLAQSSNALRVTSPE